MPVPGRADILSLKPGCYDKQFKTMADAALLQQKSLAGGGARAFTRATHWRIKTIQRARHPSPAAAAHTAEPTALAACRLCAPLAQQRTSSSSKPTR